MYGATQQQTGHRHDAASTLTAVPGGPALPAEAGLEETLDPSDWDEFRRLAHRMVDRMLDWQRDVREGPAWRPVPDSVDRLFESRLPERGEGAEAAWSAFLDRVLPYPTGLQHPTFWGWAGGAGTPMGMMADMLGAGMNSVPGNFNDGAARVEREVLGWMKEAMGFPSDSGGIVLSGGSMANIVGLTVARDYSAGYDIGRRGVGAVPGRLLLYASREVHSSVFKAAHMLGLGRDSVRLVGVDAAFRMDVNELTRMVAADRAAGDRPFAVVGTAGTINTGAIDDLDAIADVAAREGLWFHVDGAFGAMAMLSERTRPLVSGLSRADSLAFDFHKWMNVNYEAGCVLIRDAAAQRRSFSAGGDYLRPLERGTGSNRDMAGARGPQLSRGFKPLKVWMMIREHGIARFGGIVEQNVRQARYLAGRVDASPVFQLMAPVSLNVVAFRAVFPGHEDGLDEINRELLMRIQEQGIAVPSSTLIGDRFVLRACICNHRTRYSDLSAFVDAAERVAREVAHDFAIPG